MAVRVGWLRAQLTQGEKENRYTSEAIEDISNGDRQLQITAADSNYRENNCCSETSRDLHVVHGEEEQAWGRGEEQPIRGRDLAK